MRSSTYLIPVLLAVGTGELLELICNPGVLGKADIARELEDSLGCVGVERLVVVEHIPDSGRAVLFMGRSG